MQGESAHVTVVFAGQSESWARWIESRISEAGGATALVRWNPLRRPPAPGAITDLLGGPGRVLIVIDDWFERLDTRRFEAWTEVVSNVLPQYQDRVSAVSVTTRPLPDAVMPLSPVGLRSLRPAAAAARVLECVGMDVPDAFDALDDPDGGPAGTGTSEPRFPDDPLDVWKAPRRNPRFLGRFDLLQQVYDQFGAAEQGIGTVVLHGPGCIGKTQVALEYVHRFSGDYDIVWWVDATGRITARQQFAELAPRLGLEAPGELSAVIRAVQHELATTDRRWLLVLDAADAPDRIADLLPEWDGGRGGHVLVTALSTEWARHAEPIAVPPFERMESVALAVRRSERLTEPRANQLAAAVQDVPLLLDQMASWLDLNPMADVDAFIHDLEVGLPDVAGSVVPSPEYPYGYQVAWARLLNTLRQESDPAWQLLNLLACFSPEVVPVRLLQTARPHGLPDALADLVREPSSWNAALRRLSEVTSMWVEYEEGPRDIQVVRTVRMHRLFHRYVRSVQAPEDAAQYARVARRVLVDADPRDAASPGNWARYAALIPHLEPSGALQAEDADVRALILNCIEYLRMRGEHADGRWLSDRAVEAWRKVYGPADREVLVAEHQLANNLRSLGHLVEAEAVGIRVHDLLSNSPEVRPIELIRAKDGLGGTLMALGRYDEAHALFKEAEARAVAELGGDEVPRTLSIRSNLAVAIGLQGRYEEALVLHQQTFETRVRLLGGKHALTLNSALRTAWMLRLLGRYQEALAIQGHNSRLHGQVLDRHHSQTLEAEHNLALCTRRDGEIDVAHALMRGVREKVLSRWGEQHPHALLVSCDYAMLLREMGDLTEALELAEATAEHYAVLQGDEHPYAIGARDNIATVLRQRGEGRAALRICEDVTRRMADAVGRGHPWAVGCAKNAMAAYASVGDHESAVELGDTTLALARTVLGDVHVLTISLLAGLAASYEEVGRAPEARELRRQAADQLGELLGPDHPQTRYILEQRLPYWDFEPQPI
ncbi:FxSxx-COOH system tetratricopeptide repeat protein [Streptomyces sp. NPDC102467]|uniref:FxSxx-COOH system tetratricopeptide repeat protein n=1 Tax=Streptomyces sp. NPDC102467 TaxID=3366179 RepID=UPI0038200456